VKTQTARIVDFIRHHPNCTTMELQLGLYPFVSNPRARISDARAAGYNVVCETRPDGRKGYTLREQPVQLSWTA
jgi:hypothetical protein